MFRLSKLPFEFNALEPFISADTIEAHFNHHHRGYVEKLNELIKGTPLENAPLDWIIQTATAAMPANYFPWQDIYNNACQHQLHSFMWHVLGPQGERLDDEILAPFIQRAEDHFGDGWIVLTLEGVAEINDTGPLPLNSMLVIDLWEHSYYLDTKWDKAQYIQNYLNAVNWDEVRRRGSNGD